MTKLHKMGCLLFFLFALWCAWAVVSYRTVHKAAATFLPAQPSSGTTMRIDLQAQGCGDVPTPCLTQNYVFQTTIAGATNTYTGTLDTNGAAVIQIPEEGNQPFEWRMKANNWLAVGAVDTLEGTPDFPIGFWATNGDVDNNNVVNAQDFILLKLAFGSTSGDPNWDQRADLNLSDSVNSQDFSILAASYGLGGQ